MAQRPKRKKGPNGGDLEDGFPNRRREDVARIEPSDLLSTVCGYFCHDGLRPVEIKEQLKEKHGIKISREAVYPLILQAAARGWIRFTPPQEIELHRRIKEDRYAWLQDLSVVPSARPEEVAFRGAKMLLEILQQHHADEVVHIGFSGGHALRLLAQRFSQLLREPAEHLPREIVFHALVAGFDVSEPTTDPNAFFTYFVDDPASLVKTSFVSFNAPAIASAGTIQELSNESGIREAYERAGEIDIIVTSASCWADPHCNFRRYLQLAGEWVEELEAIGCVGDILWQPLGEDGPIDVQSSKRAMTVIDLDEVSQFVANKNRVLLVAGPCGVCKTPKTEVVKAILHQSKRIITHLAIDSGCARALLSARPQ
jgi:DNA-binding transcriptional regulator LsrR (DeoR family)